MDPLSVARNIIAVEIAELDAAASKTVLESKINQLVLETMDFVDKNIIDNKTLNLNEKIDQIAKLAPDILILRKKIIQKNFDSLDNNIKSLYLKIKTPEPKKESSIAFTEEELQLELEREMSSAYSKLAASENKVDIKASQNEENAILEKLNQLPKPSNENPLPTHLFLNEHEKLNARFIFASTNKIDIRANKLHNEFFKDKVVGTFFVIENTHPLGFKDPVNYLCVKGKNSIIHMIPVDKKNLNEKNYAEILKNLRTNGNI